MKFEIIAATQYDYAAWQVRQPLPKLERMTVGQDGAWRLAQPGEQSILRQSAHLPNTRIEKIQLVGDSVEIWALASADKGRGRHITLCKPQVSVLTSVAPRELWDQAMAELDSRERVEEVVDGTEKSWLLNKDVPDQDTLTIVRMAMIGEGVEVFAMPKPGTPFDSKGVFLHFQLMPFYVKQISATSDLNDWMMLQTEYAQMALELEEDDEEDDEDEEEEEPLALAPTGDHSMAAFPNAPPPAPTTDGKHVPTAPNGTATQITPES